jgi:hypothetical protein
MMHCDGKFVLLQPPVKKLEVKEELTTTSWFGLKGGSVWEYGEDQINWEHVEESTRYVEKVIEEEAKVFGGKIIFNMRKSLKVWINSFG